MLADAIYFKGTWLYPFDKTKTAPADFHLINGDTKEVPMMSQLCTNSYYGNDQFQMVDWNMADELISESGHDVRIPAPASRRHQRVHTIPHP